MIQGKDDKIVDSELEDRDQRIGLAFGNDRDDGAHVRVSALAEVGCELGGVGLSETPVDENQIRTTVASRKSCRPRILLGLAVVAPLGKKFREVGRDLAVTGADQRPEVPVIGRDFGRRCRLDRVEPFEQ